LVDLILVFIIWNVNLEIASSSDHPFLVNLFAGFQTHQHVFFVMEVYLT